MEAGLFVNCNLWVSQGRQHLPWLLQYSFVLSPLCGVWTNKSIANVWLIANVGGGISSLLDADAIFLACVGSWGTGADGASWHCPDPWWTSSGIGLNGVFRLVLYWTMWGPHVLSCIMLTCWTLLVLRSLYVVVVLGYPPSVVSGILTESWWVFQWYYNAVPLFCSIWYNCIKYF
jgi:hypothetical protein